MTLSHLTKNTSKDLFVYTSQCHIYQAYYISIIHSTKLYDFETVVFMVVNYACIYDRLSHMIKWIVLRKHSKQSDILLGMIIDGNHLSSAYNTSHIA